MDPTSIASGSSVATLFLTLGVAYLAVMSLGAYLVKVPADDWKPDGWEPKEEAEGNAMVTTASVSANSAIRTPQFWLLWIVLFCNVTAGIGILEQAAPMIQDFFREGADTTVSAAAAAGFVGLLSVCNMLGRFVWSTTSDVIGRKMMYVVYLGLGMVFYVMLALFGGSSTLLFVAFAGVIISFYGGGFATVPAYLKDMFGGFQVGAIHGRLLIAWSAAGVVGPLIINGFLDAEGTPGELTADAYRPALLTMVGVLAVGFVANLLVRPVAEKHQEDEATSDASDDEPVDTTSRSTDSKKPVLALLAWVVVGGPLLYGLVETIRKTTTLFG